MYIGLCSIYGTLRNEEKAVLIWGSDVHERTPLLMITLLNPARDLVGFYACVAGHGFFSNRLFSAYNLFDTDFQMAQLCQICHALQFIYFAKRQKFWATALKVSCLRNVWRRCYLWHLRTVCKLSAPDWERPSMLLWILIPYNSSQWIACLIFIGVVFWHRGGNIFLVKSPYDTYSINIHTQLIFMFMPGS